MKVDIKVPEVGESVKEALLAEWYKSGGDSVEKDELLFVIETDKVTLEVPADEGGILEILVEAGKTVEIGKVVGRIDTAAAAQQPAEKEGQAIGRQQGEETASAAPAPEKKAAAEPARKEETRQQLAQEAAAEDEKKPVLPPSVRRLISEKGVDASKINGTGPGGQITKGDVIAHLESDAAQKAPRQEEAAPESRESPKSGEDGIEEKTAAPEPDPEAVTRKPMSPIRKRIAAHMLEAKQNTAMLTTFNEIDMSRAKTLRQRYKETFSNTYGVGLGYMSFFVKAVVSALKEFPEINARIDGEEIVYHHYYHIGIAIGAEKGLVVPVIRNADKIGFAEIESAIGDFAERVSQNRITLSELAGGTFTITNGGIYGSLLSTPILNMPQSGILGMHKIEDRPVAAGGEVVIRPMMYVALSYDHRIVDGKDAVNCLRRIKEFIETPERMIMEI
ncbi:MAG: 2-oxoglutarate dehydrogenase complex dihydrolipoyllysine-residue succinyltransferase [Desulfobacterales bacterium]|nr:2-oxoglutarate dehydrogenase complex dihydrolipoyllysine-residue succinyltransferase [Desulfobacterales bacterium]MBS3755043.1 2-oxoglutarate dehydrogenase complex dihydrolipoyllysine-residue succinyltransferase [Desulfobacterales bacterium]